LTSIVPAMVTSPLASIVTGVFAAFRRNLTVTPRGMLIVVKLKTPLGGSASVMSAVGLNAPSAPVLPLLNVWATAGVLGRAAATEKASASRTIECLIFGPPYSPG